jgi:hypothetical protein
MAKNPIGHNRRNLAGKMIPARPVSPEEAEFIKAFANALKHATAVVAADPNARPFPAGSIAEHVREAYSGFRPDQRLAIGHRAKARLSASTEERRQYFGSYAEVDADAWYRSGPGLDREMKAQLKQAVWARLDAQRQEIEDALSNTAATTFVGGDTTKTWVEAGYFGGDMQVGWKDLTINQPYTVHFRWGTEEIGAERGVWQLFRVGKSGQEVHLASGPAGQAPGGTFDINLGTYLPPDPPVLPAVYRVRVTPGTNTKMAPGVMKGHAGPKIPGKAVGLPSDPVVITYTGIITPPVEFPLFEIYTRLWFTLGSIYLVKDQIGPGAEEFHIAGFVHESLPTSSTQKGTQEKFGKFYAELPDPDGSHEKQLSHASIFYLNSPSTPEWPRAYTVVISVLEEDDGGSLNDWQATVWAVAKDVISGELGKAIPDWLDEYIKEHLGEEWREYVHIGIHAGGEVAQVIGAIIGSVASGIAGMVIAHAAFVVANIIAGMADDYYGTEVSTFVLPTNTTEYVHSLPGQVTTDGGFELETPDGFSMSGHTQWPDAAPTDGLIDITFHWELAGKAIG